MELLTFTIVSAIAFVVGLVCVKFKKNKNTYNPLDKMDETNMWL